MKRILVKEEYCIKKITGIRILEEEEYRNKINTRIRRVLE